MDRIRITGLKQGTYKLKDGTFSIGFKSKYGITWVSVAMFPQLFSQNPVIEKLFENHDNGVDEENLIGRYLHISNKYEEWERDGRITTFPRL